MASLSPHAKTFYEALKPHTQQQDALVRFIPFLHLFKRMLGIVPASLPVMSLSNATINTVIGLFSPSFNVPAVDMGLSKISTALRQKAFLASSIAFQCAYCTAHACSFGDMLGGSMEEQWRRGAFHQSDTIDPDSPHMTDAERAVIRFVNTVSRRGVFPSELVLSPLAAAVKQEVGSAGLEMIMGMLCMVGWLNTCMNIMGTELEGKAEWFAKERLGSMGIKFNAGIHKSTESTSLPSDSHWSQGVLGAITNIFGFLQMIPFVISVMAVERELYAGIPSDLNALDDWLFDKLGGSTPGFTKNITNVQFKRAVCFGLRENMLPEGNENGNEERVWNHDERCALMFLYGDLVGNDGMKQLAESLSLTATRDDLQSFVDGVPNETWSNVSIHARQVVVDHSLKLEVSPETIELLQGCCKPEGIMELIGFVSWLCFWHRSSMLFRCRP